MFYGKYPIEITPAFQQRGCGDFKLLKIGGYGDVPVTAYWEPDPTDRSGRAQKIYLKDCTMQPSK
jgi:hypothetical protein